MQITHDIIKALKPCANRYQNFVEHHPNFIGSSAEFLSLDKITYEDKVWAMTRLITQNQNILWGVKCAYSVLAIFEKDFPSDKRPRKLLAFMSKIKDLTNIPSENLVKLIKLRKNAHLAASNIFITLPSTCAVLSAICVADRAILGDATLVSYATIHAAIANAYSKRMTLYKAKKAQQDLNLKLLLEVL